MSRTVLRPAALLFALALLPAAAPLLSAADAETPKSFDLPAADASISLQEFSDQSGEQIIYPVDAVRGVTTNAVVGQFLPRAALDRLVAGTPLVVVQDERTGALTVKRQAPAAPADPPADAATVETGPNGQAVQLGSYIVTGTNIPTAADATDVPVTVVGQQDLAETGENANLLDVLRKRIPAFMGRSNVGNGNATNSNEVTAGGSQIQLRNLETLILINGRRIAYSGANAINGGKNFVDVNQIPTAAIDHIEVLTDGASAIYGSDAVGGVVNIILKSDYSGAEIGGRYAISPNNGNYSERSGYITAGGGRDGVNITVVGSWSETDPLWQSQRPFIANNLQVKSNVPGLVGSAASGYYYLSPGVNSPSQNNPVGTAATATSLATLAANGTYQALSAAPTVNLAPDQTILMQTDQKAAVATLTAPLLAKQLVLFGDYEGSDTKSFEQTNTFLSNVSTGVTVPADSPFDPLSVAVANVNVGDSNLPEQIYNHARGDRGVIGFRGDIGARWNWEVGGTYSQEDLTQDLANLLFKPNLAAAIAGGYNASGGAVVGGGYSKVIQLAGYPLINNTILQPALDPFARANENPASLSNVFGTEVITAESILKGLDVTVVGKPFDLPAGQFALAVGAATRQESIAGSPDPNGYFTAQNWVGGTFFNPFAHSRTIDSYYGETRIPITSPTWSAPGLHSLDLSLAGRLEKYSDAGTSRVPKIGLRWEPFDDELAFRYTYSQAFAAPDQWHEYGPESATVATSSTFFATNIGISNPLLNQSFTYYSGNGNNPELKPNTAWSRSFGAVISPHALKGFTLDLDYVDIFEKGIPAGIGAGNIVASVNALGSASPYFSAIAVGGIPGTPGATQAPLAAPNGLYNLLISGNYQSNLYILDHFVNSGGVHEEALDFSPQYQIATEGMGTFTIGSTGTYLAHFLVSNLPSLPFYEFAGYSTNTQTEAGTFPHWAFYTTFDWNFHHWDFTIGNQYMSSMTDIGAVTNGTTYAPADYLANHAAVPIAYYTSWDGQIGYTFNREMADRLWSWLKGVRVAVGVNDIFNRYGPYAGLSQAAANNYNNVDTNTYSPIGRLFYVTSSIRF